MKEPSPPKPPPLPPSSPRLPGAISPKPPVVGDSRAQAAGAQLSDAMRDNIRSIVAAAVSEALAPMREWQQKTNARMDSLERDRMDEAWTVANPGKRVEKVEPLPPAPAAAPTPTPAAPLAPAAPFAFEPFALTPAAAPVAPFRREAVAPAQDIVVQVMPSMPPSMPPRAAKRARPPVTESDLALARLAVEAIGPGELPMCMDGTRRRRRLAWTLVVVLVAAVGGLGIMAVVSQSGGGL